MKRIFTILCICFCLIPLFAFPTSAASYDLGTPESFYYTVPMNAYDTFLYAKNYLYDEDTETFSTFLTWPTYGTNYGFHYFSDWLSSKRSLWGEGSLDVPIETNLPFSSIISGTDIGEPVFFLNTTVDPSNILHFEQFAFERLYLPFNGQILKVSFSWVTPLYNLPDDAQRLLNPDLLCFLMDDVSADGFNNEYSFPKVFPTSSAVIKSNAKYTFNFYFDLSQTNLEPLMDSDNICLGFRVPYYFGIYNSVDNRYEYGVRVVSQASIPTTYEILTIGGYDQDLDNIKNSVDSLKTELLDFYTDQDSSDVAFISNANTVFDDGKNVVNDYNNANDKIQQLVTGAVIPDMQDIIDEQVGLTGNVTDAVKELFQNTYIVSAFLICFAFCLISVLLYGVRG